MDQEMIFVRNVNEQGRKPSVDSPVGLADHGTILNVWESTKQPTMS